MYFCVNRWRLSESDVQQQLWREHTGSVSLSDCGTQSQEHRQGCLGKNSGIEFRGEYEVRNERSVGRDQKQTRGDGREDLEMKSDA